MAKKKQDSKRTMGVDRHLRPRLAFHLDQDLLDALKRYMVSVCPPTTITTTAVLVVSLEEFLRGKGFWPPPEKESKS